MNPGEPDHLAESARSLRALLAAIEAGEVEATPDQVAYLAGAADTLDALVQRPAGPGPSAIDLPSG